MTTSVSLEQVATLAAKLPPADRLRLVERIAHELAAPPAGPETPQRRCWREIRGMVTYPFYGEDAQAWVSRTRRESDEQREKQWRRTT